MTDQDNPNMPNRSKSELERALHDALRPIAPPREFEKRIMSAIDAASRRKNPFQRGEPARTRRAPSRRSMRWALASVAAGATAVAITLGVRSHRAQVREAQSEQVSSQVLVALRITNDQLTSAFRLVDDEMSADSSSRTRGHQRD